MRTAWPAPCPSSAAAATASRAPPGSSCCWSSDGAGGGQTPAGRVPRLSDTGLVRLARAVDLEAAGAPARHGRRSPPPRTTPIRLLDPSGRPVHHRLAIFVLVLILVPLIALVAVLLVIAVALLVYLVAFAAFVILAAGRRPDPRLPARAGRSLTEAWHDGRHGRRRRHHAAGEEAEAEVRVFAQPSSARRRATSSGSGRRRASPSRRPSTGCRTGSRSSSAPRPSWQASSSS